MKRQVDQHVDWLEDWLDDDDYNGHVPYLPFSEVFLWIIVELNPNLDVYGLTNDLQILKVMFLLAQALKILLRPSMMASIPDLIFIIEQHTNEEVREGCIELRAFDLAFNSQPRKLTFCITHELLYYYEYDVVKLYMLLSDDVNDLHYYAA